MIGDGAPRAALTLALWEPPTSRFRGEAGALVRRSATAEAASMLADLVVEGVPTLAFVRSRRGAETVAVTARRLLGEVDRSLVDQVAAYRGGYLPEERRVLEQDLTIANGYLTPKLSVKRNVVLKDFASEVDALYDGPQPQGTPL